jgi:hypothetical protein
MESKEINVNKIPFKFDSRYVLKDTPTRIRRMVNDEKFIENLMLTTKLPYVFTNEPIPLEFNYSLSEAMVKESYSKISWLLTHRDVQSPILISFNLTENTLEKTTLLIFEMEIIKRELIPKEYVEKIINTFPEICIEVIKNIGKELEEDNKDIYHYESKIFNYSREKIWDIITNIHCLMNKQGIIKNCSLQTPITKKGADLSFFVGCNLKKKLCTLNINKYKKDEKINKWVLGYSPKEGPFEHSENYWTLIKLGENETLVTNTTKYSEHIDPEILQKLSEQKKDSFLTIENLLKEKDQNDNINVNTCQNKINQNNNEINDNK